jgi:5-methylcytosine-specific restriction protein A
MFEGKVYSYTGQVELASNPYMEDQPDADGNTRKVYVFPLKLRSGIRPNISNKQLEKQNQVKRKQARKLSNQELEKRANSNQGKDQNSSRDVTTRQYIRNQNVVEYSLRRANGVCQLCLQPAPFQNKQGKPFLEVHHIEWLAQGGEDSIANTVALCPNCHRKMHALNHPSDIQKLRNELARKPMIEN